MSQAKIALLPDRGIVRVAGEDAGKLLQGIITNDMALLAHQPAVHAGLLTPQGKILFEFFVVKGDGFLLEAAKDRVAELVKRLTMYKLRARATIEDVSENWDVWAVWGTESAEGPWMLEAQFPEKDLQVVDIDFLESKAFRDPRFWDSGSRWLVYRRLRAQLQKLRSAHRIEALESGEYDSHRIALGVPEGGKDYAFGDTFPHEANFDVLGGISFSKGCFVGQEVVSRMQHRGGARKRIVIVEGEHPLQPGTEIMAGPATIGTIGSVAGNRGLALLRLDRAEEAMGKGEPLIAAGGKITTRLPGYLKAAATVGAS